MSEGARFALALLGALLLLPGACSLYFTPLGFPLLIDLVRHPGGYRDGDGLFYLLVWLSWPAGFLLSAFGVRLMWRASKG